MGASHSTTGDASVTRRRTPYDLIFANESFEQDTFPSIAAEARRAAIDASDPDAFLLLANVGELLRRLTDVEERSGEPERAEPSATTFGSMAALVFQAFQFWRFGRRVWGIEGPLLRRIVGPELGVGAWTLTPPHPAGYVQLPHQNIWARVDEAAPAEPVDGFFWTMAGEGDDASPRFRRLDVLLALGVRPDRPGVSVIETAVALSEQSPAHWADMKARADGQDFANILPGGELRDLHALVNIAEVFKLVSRVFWIIATEPTAVRVG